MSKFTPGQWKVDGSGMGVYMVNEAGFGPVVATAAMPDVSLMHCRENAKLIAAAPELLAALESLLLLIKRNAPDLSGKTIGMAEAAIAKAKGATP